MSMLLGRQEFESPRTSLRHLPLRFNKTDVMFRHCSLYEEQWRAVYNIGSTRTTPQEKVLFIDMCTSEIRYRPPWLNSSVQHRVECIFAGTGASALRKSWVRVGQKSRIAEIYPCNAPGPHTATTRRSGSRTRDSGAGGGRSNKERQRLQPLASVARAPLFEVRRVRFYTQPLLA